MSKDFFKVKKGLNIKPQDPSELSDLQDGDIIVDSTDDNRLKVYDSVGGDFASVGTGGSSGNILKDIEKLTPVVSNVVAVTDTVTFLPIDDNNKSVKATFSGSDGSIRYEAAASADLDGVQGTVEVWLKTSLDNLTISSTKDGVIQSSVSVNSNNKWRQYLIPVVLGNADYGFEISASGAVAGDVFIDEAFVKVKKLTENLGQAQFVGELTVQGDVNCRFENSSGSYSEFPDDTGCDGSYSVIGNVSAPPTSKPNIIINNARTDGYYHIEAKALFATVNTTNSCYFTLSNTTSFDNQPVMGLVTTGNQYGYEVDGDFRFTSGGDKTIRILSESGDGTSACRIFADGSTDANLRDRSLKITVHFFPDSNSTIVSQDTELTAQTANTLTAAIDSSGNVTRQNYDWINGNCSLTGTSDVSCSLNITTNGELNCSFIIESPPENRNVYVTAQTSTSIDFVSKVASTDTDAPANYIVTCEKTGTDVNKSQTIIGKFEQIEEVTADLTAATANEFSAKVSNTGVVSDENYDFIDGSVSCSSGAFNGTFVSGVFSSNPNCTAIIDANSSLGVPRTITLNTSTTAFSGATFQGTTKSCNGFVINCSRSTDTNKSFTGAVINASQSAQTIADIVREDIISTDLCQVEANSNDGETISAGEDIPFKTKVKDNCNTWGNGGNTGNNTNDQFTAPRDGFYLFNFHIITSSTVTAGIDAYVNGTLSKRVCDFIGESQEDCTSIINLSAGDLVTFRPTASITLNSGSGVQRHYINITELPDNASVLESLNQNPRLQLDQYSETEIEWGRWNGQQLYRRCFTVASDITVSGTVLATFDTGLILKDKMKISSTLYMVKTGLFFTGTDFSYIRYDETNGQITVQNAGGGRGVYDNTSICLDYTK